MLKKAYVEITNRCNLACSFCPKTKREPRTMSAQEFGLVLAAEVVLKRITCEHANGVDRALG